MEMDKLARYIFIKSALWELILRAYVYGPQKSIDKIKQQFNMEIVTIIKQHTNIPTHNPKY